MRRRGVHHHQMDVILMGTESLGKMPNRRHSAEMALAHSFMFALCRRTVYADDEHTSHLGWHSVELCVCGGLSVVKNPENGFKSDHIDGMLSAKHHYYTKIVKSMGHHPVHVPKSKTTARRQKWWKAKHSWTTMMRVYDAVSDGRGWGRVGWPKWKQKRRPVSIEWKM